MAETTAIDATVSTQEQPLIPAFPPGGTMELWISTPSNDHWLEPSHDSIQAGSQYSGIIHTTIILNPSQRYQTMDGFGASLTEASTWLIKNQLSPPVRERVMESLFGPTGIHLSMLRQPMGASDFNFEAWTYGDTPNNSNDFDLKYFSLEREQDSIRPVLDMALAVDPGRIKIIGSPWSPPAWMKTGRHLYGNRGGTLRPNVYESYARYFLKYLREYEALGSPIYAITVQNEPKFAAPWPGMTMSAHQQIDFIQVLGSLLAAEGYGHVKILAYDHNYDDINYARTVLQSSAAQYIAGTAWHYYSNLFHQNLTTVHNEFPDKGQWFTEGGTGTWIGGGTEEGMFLDLMMHTIRFPRNWARSYITWNVALDQNSGPALDGIDDANRGLVTIRSDRIDQIHYNNTYYGLGHSSRFVQPGAVRIESTPSIHWRLEQVAYENPDGSIVVVLVNHENSVRTISIKSQNRTWEYIITLPGKSGATFVVRGIH